MTMGLASEGVLDETELRVQTFLRIHGLPEIQRERVVKALRGERPPPAARSGPSSL